MQEEGLVHGESGHPTTHETAVESRANGRDTNKYNVIKKHVEERQ